MKEDIKAFEEWQVRRVFDEKTETWYFSVIDIVGILSASENPKRYWSDLKRKLAKEGSEAYEKIVRLRISCRLKSLIKSSMLQY